MYLILFIVNQMGMSITSDDLDDIEETFKRSDILTLKIVGTSVCLFTIVFCGFISYKIYSLF